MLARMKARKRWAANSVKTVDEFRHGDAALKRIQPKSGAPDPEVEEGFRRPSEGRHPPKSPVRGWDHGDSKPTSPQAALSP